MKINDQRLSTNEFVEEKVKLKDVDVLLDAVEQPTYPTPF